MPLPPALQPFFADLPAPSRSLMGAGWVIRQLGAGQTLTRQGEPTDQEYLLLSGRITSDICDADGRSVCVAFHAGPAVVTPQIARSNDGISLVSLEAQTDAVIAQLPADDLLEMMVQSQDIRDWANGILRLELARKTEREWALAALGGMDRLNWFRQRYPHHETTFGHARLASFLGMTPVTFSRLRAAARPD